MSSDQEFLIPDDELYAMAANEDKLAEQGVQLSAGIGIGRAFDLLLPEVQASTVWVVTCTFSNRPDVDGAEVEGVLLAVCPSESHAREWVENFEIKHPAQMSRDSIKIEPRNLFA